MEKERKANRLIKEKSPYLLEHAYNPVDWYPWGNEALRKAKNDNKPIFLSIGYSTCHWCHALRRESFEDDETAAMLNKNFIPIKVDREERPELDSFYMAAVQSMTGQGGWPLSVFLTPDLKPFYGGTYFPPEPRYGMPSFKQVLEFVATTWKDRREATMENARQIMEALQQRYQLKSKSELSPGTLEAGYATLVSSFDEEHGGYGRAPKFPLPLYMAFLLRYHYRTKKELALRSVVLTLEEIAKGGIRDHLGGGFHRYSTDRIWLVPHFEKMLYDNALLAKTYLEAYQVTKDPFLASTAVDTLSWMMAELRGPDGAFYSAQDADTAEGEGIYYTWTPDEISSVLGAQDGEAFCYLYGVTRNGNFEASRSILNLAHSVEETALRYWLSQDELTRKIKEWRSSLYQTRLRRPRPATDVKVLTSWNGLAISALAKASTVLDDKKYLTSANEAAEFVVTKLMRDGRLLRRFAGGEAALPGTLEDYSFFVQGLIDLFEAGGDPRWLGEALRLNEQMLEALWDEEGGALFLSEEGVPTKIKEGYDGPTPSGNSVASVNLLRLAELTGRTGLKEKANQILQVFSDDMEQQPSGHTSMMVALDLALNGMKEVVITGSKEQDARMMAAEFGQRFLPDAVLLVATAHNHDSLVGMTQLLEGRVPGKTPTVYICENFACKKPITSVEELKQVLDAASS